MNLHSHGVVTFDQALNPARRVSCESWMLALCGEWSGGKYAGWNRLWRINRRDGWCPERRR